MNRAFVGIDLAIAKRKRLPISVCKYESGKLIPLPLIELKTSHPKGFGNKCGLESGTVNQYAIDTYHYLREIERMYDLSIACVAIDAPSDYRLESIDRRRAEKAMDQQRISCFTTPSRSEFKMIIDKAKLHLSNGGEESRIPHANQIWMLTGFSLFRVLRKYYKCIEVFPQAIVRKLGVSKVHKSNQEGYQLQLQALAIYTGWESSFQLSEALRNSCGGASHDRLDAFMSAWLSWLYCNGRAKPLGIEPEDAIWIPDVAPVSLVHKEDSQERRASKAMLPEIKETVCISPHVDSECLCCKRGIRLELPRICPECHHVFKGIGWGGIDAHWRSKHESSGVLYEQFIGSLCENHR